MNSALSFPGVSLSNSLISTKPATGAGTTANDQVKSAGRASGGSSLSASWTCAAAIVGWQLAPWGSAAVGVATKPLAPEGEIVSPWSSPLQRSRSQPAAGATGALNVTESVATVATWEAPSAGATARTAGGASVRQSLVAPGVGGFWR